MEDTRETEFLDVDDPIRGQDYVLLSFVVPETSLQEKKEAFLFQKYLKDKREKFNTVLEEEVNISGKNAEELKIERALLIEKLFENDSTLLQDYQGFKKQNSEQLNNEFSTLVKNITHITGLKVRGSYGSEAEARSKAGKLQKLDRSHNIYVAQVGYWIPFNPNPEEIGDDEYQEEKLNELMKGYKENKENSRQHFEERKREMAEDAIKKANEQKEKNEQLLLEEGNISIEEQTDVESAAVPKELEEDVEVESEPSIPKSDEMSSMMESFNQQPFLGSSSRA